MDPDLSRAVLAGGIGALSMSVSHYLFHLIRVPMVDFGRLIATKILGYHTHGTRLGLALHILTGVILALVYSELVMSLLVGAPWLRGISYGGLLWLVMMLLVLPVTGDGFFGWKASRTMAVSALASHLLYGLILGVGIRP
jgi:hypothetical protein